MKFNCSTGGWQGALSISNKKFSPSPGFLSLTAGIKIFSNHSMKIVPKTQKHDSKLILKNIKNNKKLITK